MDYLTMSTDDLYALIAQHRSVQTGDQDAIGTAITQGVKPGEKVVILSAQPIRDGQGVRIDNSPMQVAGQPMVERGSAPK